MDRALRGNECGGSASRDPKRGRPGLIPERIRIIYVRRGLSVAKLAGCGPASQLCGARHDLRHWPSALP